MRLPAEASVKNDPQVFDCILVFEYVLSKVEFPKDRDSLLGEQYRNSFVRVYFQFV